jgi:hypothetical protein
MLNPVPASLPAEDLMKGSSKASLDFTNRAAGVLYENPSSPLESADWKRVEDRSFGNLRFQSAY